MRKLLVPFLSLCAAKAYAFEPFVVQDIKLEGLQRISIGTVFNYLPIKVGDEINEDLTSVAIKKLFTTGFFKDVKIEREGNVLVVFVAERPAIAEVTLTGNSALPTEQLEGALKQIGLKVGHVLDRSVVTVIEQELQRQYYSLGKYAVKIETTVTPLERNRVNVEVKIAEGESANIYAFNIVGNTVFKNQKLLNLLELGGSGALGGRKEYSKQLFAADLETLKSYYQDRGYINFRINSTQVSLTPDKQDVYITVNVTEGNKYKVNKIALSGNLIATEDELRKLITFKKGDVFSRKKASLSRTNINDRLSEDGYAFANINLAPTVNEKNKTVDLTFFVDPGRRVYVNRINIYGNIKTKDEVIRREIRQMEGDWMSAKSIAQSKKRLNRLGFFDDITVETPAVENTNDQVDVNYTVSERSTGSLSAGLGYNDTQGAIINFSISQNNFVGTGNRVSVSINNSSVVQNNTVSYTNPYYTQDGISRGFNIYKRKFSALQASISNYSTNSYGAGVNYGIPMSESDSFGLGLSYDTTEIVAGSTATQVLKDFIAVEGNTYSNYKARLSWSHDTRNKAIFADHGNLASGSVDVTLPGSDLEYYKLSLRYLQYFALAEDVTLLFNSQLGYGKSYGDTTILPPYENYYAGGSRSVRGYDSNRLGPRDPATNNPLGGNKRVVTNLELILPNPFAENSKSIRFSLFLDAGNVFAEEESIGLGKLRTSLGAALIWITPVGLMRFSWANTLNDEPGDDTKSFQFTLGSTF
ncbi:Outer membrane protein assembly factor YaeT [hydrothermal vent metagenome]|uniref:Outer membrane protein assembly factor YaeT n=1 Tax=hydrothermal vent metagenome TaxID=652676 RepID=A0A3B1AHB0_9ZZZZ